MGVLVVGASQKQPGHQGHALQAVDAAAEEHSVQSGSHPPQPVIFPPRHAAAGVDLGKVPLFEMRPPPCPLQPVRRLMLVQPVGQDLLQLPLPLPFVRPLLFNVID